MCQFGSGNGGVVWKGLVVGTELRSGYVFSREARPGDSVVLLEVVES